MLHGELHLHATGPDTGRTLYGTDGRQPIVSPMAQHDSNEGDSIGWRHSVCVCVCLQCSFEIPNTSEKSDLFIAAI